MKNNISGIEKANRIADICIAGFFIFSTVLVAIMGVKTGRERRNGK